MKQSIFEIKTNEALTDSVMKMTLVGDTSDITASGQFVNIKLDGLFLRRPISVCDSVDGELTLIYKVVGKGTEQMRNMTAGEKLDVLTGLGNGYELSVAGDTPLLIGGGVGVPPMYMLAKQLISAGKRVSVILGFNTKSEVFCEEDFKALGADVTTEQEYYVQGTVSSVKELSTQYGNASYTITSEGTTVGFDIYRGKYLNGASFTAADQLKVGDKVVVCGKLVNFKGNTPQMAQGSKLISINGQGGSTPDTPGTGEQKTIFSSLAESATELPAGWTIDNGTLPTGLEYVWSWKTYQEKGYLNASAYLNGTALATEAYAISPEIDLTGATEVSLTFDHAAKFQTTLKSLCGVVVRVVGTTTWTKLEIPTWPASGAWTFANSGAISLEAFAGKKIQVAFKYGSNATGADTWEIKNLVVTGKK